MAKLYSYDPLIALAKESNYGTALTTPTDKILGVLSWDEGLSEFDIYKQQQTPVDQITTKRSGKENPNFTIDGEFNDGLEFMLKAITQDATAPYTFPTAATAAWGHTVTYGKPSAENALSTVADLLVGAVLTELNISGSAGDDVVKFSSTWVAQSLEHGEDVSAYVMTGITDAKAPNHVPFLFYNVAVSALGGDITNMNSFNLTLRNTLNPEDNQFQNNQNRQQPTVIGYGGDLEIEYIADDTIDDGGYDNLYGQTALPITLTFANGTTTYTFTLYGQIVKWERPDADEGEAIGKITYRLCEDDDNIPLSIAVA